MEPRVLIDQLEAAANRVLSTFRLLFALAGAGVGISAGMSAESGLFAFIAAGFCGALGALIGTAIGDGRALPLRAQAAILRLLLEKR